MPVSNKFRKAALTSMKAKRSMQFRRKMPVNRNFVNPPGRLAGSVGERKDITILQTANFVAGSTTAVVSVINPVSQGVSQIQRIGRKILMKSLYMRFTTRLAPTTSGTSSLRVIVLYDKQANGSAPATTTVPFLTDQITSPNNLSYSSRFATVLDEMVPCLGTAGPQAASFERFVKLNLPVEFNTNNNGDITDIATGALLMYVWQDGGLTVAAPASQIYTRIRFEDN